MTTIRDAMPADEAAWRRLWDGYLRFYSADVPEAVTAATWRRILDPASPIFARLAQHAAGIVGFSVCVLHEGTWTTDPVCYLEDLFVAPDARGMRIGSALLRDLVDCARTKGWSRVYWHTQASNHAARRLYDTFIAADDFVRYRLILR